jgi:hypothetical protein
MPICFTLTKFDKNEPEILADVDVDICNFFNEEVHPTQWNSSWMDSTGMRLAMIGDFDKVRETYVHDIEKNEFGCERTIAYWQRQVEIVDFLKSNFLLNNWGER